MDITKRQITKIAREVSKFTIRTLREDGIGTAEFDVIHAIRKNPGITQAGVCKIVGIDKGAVARQTANLEAKGYLIRKENPADGRSQLLFPTEKAESLKNSKAHIESLFYEWLTGVLSDQEREEFAGLLDILYLRCNHCSHNGHIRNSTKAEKVGGFGELSAVCPFFVAVPTFPVRSNRGDNIVNLGSESFCIFYGHFFDNVDEGVHLTKAHVHTFQSRSSRKSRLTVSHTCSPACTLSAKKPPVLPSLDS